MRQLTLLLFLMVASLAGYAREPAHFVERTLQPHGTSHPRKVFVPDGWTAKHAWPLVLFLHGGERYTEFPGVGHGS